MSPRQDTPGDPRRSESIPRGIEVLVKKASVDPQFKELLLQARAEAAEAIDLELTPAEEMMLRVVPREQLEAIIARTNVPQSHRRAFLGTAAAAMLAVLGVAETASAGGFGSGGIRPQTEGIRRLYVPPNPVKGIPDPTFARRVIAVLAEHCDTPANGITLESRLEEDLGIDQDKLATIRREIEGDPDGLFFFGGPDKLDTVGQLVDEAMARSDVGRTVIGVMERQLREAVRPITPQSRITEDLKADLRQLSRMRTTLMTRLRVHLSGDVIRQAETVGDVIQYAADVVAKREAVQREREARKAADVDSRTPPMTMRNRPDPPWRGGIGGIMP